MPALDGLSAGARDWVEVEPFVWYDTGTGERLAAEVTDGRIVRISIDAASPFMAFEPAPAGVHPAWLMPALLISHGLALPAALHWPGRPLIRRHYHHPLPLAGRPRAQGRPSRR